MNVQSAKIGGLNVKMWDVGGQTQFRTEWGRYASGCQAIIFVVDTHDTDRIIVARHELHQLLDELQGRRLENTPILILANKIDLQPHLSEIELVESLNLDYVTENPWEVVGISALRGNNVARVVDWLIKRDSLR